MVKKNWIKDAINPKHIGAFTAKAKEAGKTTAAYTKSVLKPGSQASSTTKKQAVLAKTLGKLKK